MKLLLEIFFIKMTGEQVSYHGHTTEITDSNVDPDQVVLKFAMDEIGSEANAEKENFVIHSTSWRYKNNSIILTYIVYSEMFTFPLGAVSTLHVNELRVTGHASKGQRVAEIDEVGVVSHAIRHLGFLVRNDSDGKYATAVDAESTEQLKSVYATLAGRI